MIFIRPLCTYADLQKNAAKIKNDFSFLNEGVSMLEKLFKFLFGERVIEDRMTLTGGELSKKKNTKSKPKKKVTRKSKKEGKK